MKEFLHVLEFELKSYFKNKSYILTSVIISALLIVGLSLPSLFDMSEILPFLKNSTNNETAMDEVKKEDYSNFAIVDEKNIVDNKFLKEFFPSTNWKEINTKDELTKLVENNEVEGGFIVNSLTEFDYIVYDSSFNDSNQIMFNEMLSTLNRIKYASDNGLNFEELESMYSAPIKSNVTILGKDGVNNFMYAYMLIFLLYFMIIMYGQLIAVSVTSEKSNRSIEILVTSISTTSLICGKVIAAAIASCIQIVLILSSGMISYSINRDSWNGILDNIFDIPFDILIVFALFGGVGYLFYAFIFGALGALVSKTEDISSSISSITMIFVVVFFIAMFGMQNSESTLMKISSFIPFSSCLTMSTRYAMGSVSNIEIIISFVILLVSTMVVAYIASKIYRMATLRYGNPIKLKDAIKLIRKNNS